jgi:hypothetical protein
VFVALVQDGDREEDRRIEGGDLFLSQKLQILSEVLVNEIFCFSCLTLQYWCLKLSKSFT